MSYIDKVHKVWYNMKHRCDFKDGRDYRYYGGRGITYCDKWKKFEPFYNWAVNNGYKEGLSLDRKNNNGSYSPENCRWATREQQNNNMRNNVFITYKGITKPLKDWASELDMKYGTLWQRIFGYKWTVKKAFEEGVKRS